MKRPSAQALLPQFRIYADTAPTKALALAACETVEQLGEFAKNCQQVDDGDGFMLASLLAAMKPTMRRWVLRQSGVGVIVRA